MSAPGERLGLGLPDAGGDAQPRRKRLPHRREAFVHTIEVGGQRYEAAVGFDPLTGEPREIFLSGARDGTDMAAILADTSVVVSVALQHGVPAQAMALSASRKPAWPDDSAPSEAASVIGAALDLLVRYEREGRR